MVYGETKIITVSRLDPFHHIRS